MMKTYTRLLILVLFIAVLFSAFMPTVTNEGSGQWVIETVDSSISIWGTSLVLDSTGNPHISYCVISNLVINVVYAVWDGSKWQSEVVDSGPNIVLNDSFLAIDNSGKPHICYQDHEKHDLKYAYKNGNAWHIETVDSAEPAYCNSTFLPG